MSHLYLDFWHPFKKKLICEADSHSLCHFWILFCRQSYQRRLKIEISNIWLFNDILSIIRWPFIWIFKGFGPYQIRVNGSEENWKKAKIFCKISKNKKFLPRAISLYLTVTLFFGFQISLKLNFFKEKLWPKRHLPQIWTHQTMLIYMDSPTCGLTLSNFSWNAIAVWLFLK